jgi:hypothetical protein
MTNSKENILDLISKILLKAIVRLKVKDLENKEPNLAGLDFGVNRSYTIKPEDKL